jgi:hypothetical protein
MKTLPRETAGQVWQQYWNEMTHEFFKVEALQDYSGEDASESLALWKQGDKQRSLKLITASPENAFTQMCRDKHAARVRLIRVHITEEPYCPYLEWEIERYRRINIPRNYEEVSLVSAKDVSDKIDFMMFDRRRVAVLHYDEGGMMTHEDFYDSKTDDIESGNA